MINIKEIFFGAKNSKTTASINLTGIYQSIFWDLFQLREKKSTNWTVMEKKWFWHKMSSFKYFKLFVVKLVIIRAS